MCKPHHPDHHIALRTALNHLMQPLGGAGDFELCNSHVSCTVPHGLQLANQLSDIEIWVDYVLSAFGIT